VSAVLVDFKLRELALSRVPELQLLGGAARRPSRPHTVSQKSAPTGVSDWRLVLEVAVGELEL